MTLMRSSATRFWADSSRQPEARTRCIPVHAGHVRIGEDQVVRGGFVFKQDQSFAGSGGGEHGQADCLEETAGEVPQQVQVLGCRDAVGAVGECGLAGRGWFRWKKRGSWHRPTAGSVPRAGERTA